jgi:NIMA-interacting peptidyl-prolyl cis-trans isomerase 1
MKMESEESPSSAPSPSPSPLAILKTHPPPEALPDGWITHTSRSHPGCAYYYNQYTEEKRWDLPIAVAVDVAVVSNLEVEGLKETIRSLTKVSQHDDADASNGAEDEKGQNAQQAAVRSILKNIPTDSALASAGSVLESDPNSRKRARDREEHKKRHAPEKKSSRGTEKVRVLHILKKHNMSRRPASWRQAKITISKEEAIAELNELVAILDESKGDAKELRATFEELAKTESDCTSSKRGGDVGFFGRKKMQPNFEKASFGLGIGEMSGVVETGSGVHVILRLG